MNQQILIIFMVGVLNMFTITATEKGTQFNSTQDIELSLDYDTDANPNQIAKTLQMNNSMFLSHTFPEEVQPSSNPASPKIRQKRDTNTGLSQYDRKPFLLAIPVFQMIPKKLAPAVTTTPTPEMDPSIFNFPILEQVTTLSPITDNADVSEDCGTYSECYPGNVQEEKPIPDKKDRTFRKNAGRCVWAVINCCDHTNRTSRNTCFVTRGCARKEWIGIDPCDDEFASKMMLAARG